MKNLKISTLLLLTLAVFMSSCGNKKKQKEELEVKKGEIAHIVSNYVYPLPSSFELMDMLNEIEAAFIIGISNPASEVDKYKTESKQALNLGVYMADVSYAAVYQRKQAAQDYLTSAEKLIRTLHVDGTFDDNFASEISAQVENRDSLVNLVTEASQSVYSDFHRQNKKELAFMMAAGAWTEAMYLTLIISDNTPLNASVIKAIMFQRNSLNKTVALLEEVKDNKDAAPILVALKGIKNTFDQEDTGSITAAQIAQLETQTNALRSMIVE